MSCRRQLKIQFRRIARKGPRMAPGSQRSAPAERRQFRGLERGQIQFAVRGLARHSANEREFWGIRRQILLSRVGLVRFQVQLHGSQLFPGDGEPERPIFFTKRALPTPWSC
jgi:hypothetical protein